MQSSPKPKLSTMERGRQQMDGWPSADGRVAVSRWTGGCQQMDAWLSADGRVAVSRWTGGHQQMDGDRHVLDFAPPGGFFSSGVRFCADSTIVLRMRQ